MGRISVEYAAGFFDGEGHVTIDYKSNRQTNWWRIRAGIGQNDRRPLDALRERWGGTVNALTKQNGIFHEWRLSAQQAVVFLNDVRPYLIVKAEAVDIVLEFQSLLRTSSQGRRRLSDDERAARADLHERLRVVTARRGRAA